MPKRDVASYVAELAARHEVEASIDPVWPKLGDMLFFSTKVDPTTKLITGLFLKSHIDEAEARDLVDRYLKGIDLSTWY